MSSKPAKHLSNRTVAAALSMFTLSVLAILLWGRIKLVAGVPRTAYAVPEVKQPARPAPAPAQPKPTAMPSDRPDLQGD